MNDSRKTEHETWRLEQNQHNRNWWEQTGKNTPPLINEVVTLQN